MVEHIPHMVDMARSPEEAEQSPFPALSQASRYPYGLCISLTEDEIEKLGLDNKDCSPGDMLHLHCMATVTACSENQTADGGHSCRIELQITHIAAEDEDEENEEEEEEEESVPVHKRLYSNSY